MGIYHYYLRASAHVYLTLTHFHFHSSLSAYQSVKQRSNQHCHSIIMAPTELLNACQSGDAGQLREILALSHVELSQSKLDEALVTAAYHDHSDLVPLLHSHGAQITDRAITGACSVDSVAMFQYFIKHGFDVNMVLKGEPVLRFVDHPLI